jgi:hypothetical protein
MVTASGSAEAAEAAEAAKLPTVVAVVAELPDITGSVLTKFAGSHRRKAASLYRMDIKLKVKLPDVTGCCRIFLEARF